VQNHKVTKIADLSQKLRMLDAKYKRDISLFQRLIQIRLKESDMPAIPEPQSVADYVADGARIAAILFIWGVIAAFFTYGVSEIGGTGSLFETIGPQIGGVIALVGGFNVILYVLYRAIDYWHQYPNTETS
jgi:hypothetical protein